MCATDIPLPAFCSRFLVIRDISPIHDQPETVFAVAQILYVFSCLLPLATGNHTL